MNKALLSAFGLVTAIALAPAHATVVNFSYSGYFGSTDLLGPVGGSAVGFAPGTPFQLNASFDDASPNLVAGLGFQGFIAHDPLTAKMTIGGTAYSVARFSDDPTGGISIAIFDQSNPFVPGKYGVGFIVDPVTDGAGVIGRFGDATAAFTVEALVPTQLTGFIGAGFRSGPGAAPGACYADPARCETVPISLTDDNGAMFALSLGTRAENVSATGLVHMASITPVPEPASVALMLVGVAGVAGVALARRRRAA